MSRVVGVGGVLIVGVGRVWGGWGMVAGAWSVMDTAERTGG